MLKFSLWYSLVTLFIITLGSIILMLSSLSDLNRNTYLIKSFQIIGYVSAALYLYRTKNTIGLDHVQYSNSFDNLDLIDDNLIEQNNLTKLLGTLGLGLNFYFVFIEVSNVSMLIFSTPILIFVLILKISIIFCYTYYFTRTFNKVYQGEKKQDD